MTRRTVEGRFGPLDASGWGEDLAKALRRIPSRDIEMVLMKIDGVKLGKIGARVGLSKSRACERIASTLLRLREMLGGSGGAIV